MLNKGSYGIDFIDEEPPDVDGDAIDYQEHCIGTHKLQSLDGVDSLAHGILMVETSGRKTLYPRQACALESAVRRSGLPVTLVMMTSELDLSDNTTCQLIMSSVTSNISIFTVNPDTLALNTPLQGFFSSNQLIQSPHKMVHTSDSLRMLLMYKYGGLYLDLDYIILNDMSHYNNFLCEEVNLHLLKTLVMVWLPSLSDTVDKLFGSMITNSAFSFPRHHPLIKMILENIVKSYSDPDHWSIIGPELITHCTRNFTETENILEINPETTGINIIRYQKQNLYSFQVFL